MKDKDAPVISYPDNALLKLSEVAAWLRVSERTVERWNIPNSLPGLRTRRYLVREVLSFLERKRVA